MQNDSENFHTMKSKLVPRAVRTLSKTLGGTPISCLGSLRYLMTVYKKYT